MKWGKEVNALNCKKIAHKLNKDYGISFGENGISKSGKRRTYYLCENDNNLLALKKLTSRK